MENAMSKPKMPCPDCGGLRDRYSTRCFKCAHRARRIRSEDDRRTVRHEREASAPGLSARQRQALLARWRRQGRSCAYCPAPATTIDHVVPLVRGGTNYEGNLTPCCRACNSGKRASFVAEWRHGRQPRRMGRPLEWLPRRPKPRRIEAIRGEQAELFRVCAACGTGHLRNSDYCGVNCQARSAYRVKVGIPLDARPYEVRAPRAA